ncbi:hypothetical protein MLOOGBEN_21805 [Bacillus sp. EB106-08-02-XG196]|uniref:hypothetical protein n=1 Tax=Bacillus sp. EB106-08-02-XG196 TaxID=2737049 RepID=UPI0015C4DD9F|nr:hypothetical protein [Bacillus sp. EB106-08-02-XG196]NWQ43340.1 hypothetical protein [Bacillus sp. EB106-08-02-XG196]
MVFFKVLKAIFGKQGNNNNVINEKEKFVIDFLRMNQEVTLNIYIRARYSRINNRLDSAKALNFLDTNLSAGTFNPFKETLSLFQSPLSILFIFFESNRIKKIKKNR